MDIASEIKEKRRSLNYTGQLAKCSRCGNSASVAYTLDYFHSPAVKVFCEKCGAHTQRKSFLCSVLTVGQPWHKVTEVEAITHVVALWNKGEVIQ